MSNQTNTIDLTQLDVRVIPCREKHARIFQQWDQLTPGQHFTLINDHDPVPLYYQFAAQFPGAFTWEYLADGPDEFRVRITRLQATAQVLPPRVSACQSKVQHKSVALVDARGLEPPQPMHQILEAAATLRPGEMLHALTDRKPVPLQDELTQRGFHHSSIQEPQGFWRTSLWHD